MENVFLSSKMLVFLFTAILLAACTDGRHISHFYNASRDYLAVTSESYPKTYPTGNTYTWEWSSPGGHWGVYFLDFDLACGNIKDVLYIGNADRDRKYFYRCENMPPDIYFEDTFTMRLTAKHPQGESDSRGFKCQVFYGKNKVEVETKINAMKAMGRNPDASNKSVSSGLSGIVVALILIIVILIIAVSVVACVVIRRRRQHQQTTNTSVHVNIDGIRRESSVSYTRNGGGRTRLESEDSLPPDSTTPTTKSRRPVKRSESNASWAMRAEMATSARTGSCSSEGHYGNTTVLNFYSPFPADASTAPAPSLGDKDHNEKGVEASETGRLSSISEESSASKIRSSLAVPAHVEETSLAIANAGYMVMTGCSGNYINYGGE